MDNLARKSIHKDTAGNLKSKKPNDIFQNKSNISEDECEVLIDKDHVVEQIQSSPKTKKKIKKNIETGTGDNKSGSVPPPDKGEFPAESNEAQQKTIGDLPKQSNDENSNKMSSLWLILAIFVLIVAICCFYKTNPTNKICNFNQLIQRYPLEDKSLWVTLKYGIEDILNLEHPQGPSVYLFIRDNSSTGPNTNFVEDIAHLTASCFDRNLKPITFTKDDFDSDDYGIAIAKYKNDIHNGGVLVVTANLNEVPGAAARALHTICDKFSPIVRKVVIFLSLIIDPKSEGIPLKIAEDTLRTLWRSSLTKNELDPLIVRVSDTVFRLKS